MQISQEFFFGAMPAAMTPSKTVFKKISPRIYSELEVLRLEIVGTATSDRLSDMMPELWRHKPSCEERAVDSMAKYACSEAFRKSIPELDLVMTDTGFGVVSNANQAPASKERVAELRRSLHMMSAIHHDNLVDSLRFVEGWTDSEQAHSLFRTLFWRISMFASLGKEHPVLDDTFDILPGIHQSEQVIGMAISPELMAELRSALRTGTVSVVQSALIDMCRVFTAAWIRRDGSSKECLRNILKFVETNIGSFRTYAESATYKANHYKRYENKKDDTCYFF